MTEAESADIVHKLLHDLGYKAEMIDDDAVGSAAGGLNFYVQLYESSIQFRCALELEDKVGGWLEFANTFNTRFRLIKIYSNEVSLIAESDWWLNTSDADFSDRFKQALDFWEISLGELKQRLRDHIQKSAADTRDLEI